MPANAQDRRGIVWDNRPSIVFGEDINIDLKGRVQLDWRRFDPEVGEDEFDVRTLRIGLKGDLTRHFDWEIEREIDEVLEEGEVEPKWRFGQWKDVFVNWTTFDAFSRQGRTLQDAVRPRADHQRQRSRLRVSRARLGQDCARPR